MKVEEKSRYFEEVARNLRRSGFETEALNGDGLLPVRWQGQPLCQITPSGGVRYLPKSVKEQVDAIVEELAKLPQVTECYEVWNQLRDELENYYKVKPRQRLPLSRQKEFKAIKNIVIQEALRLGQMELRSEQIPSPPLPDAPAPEVEDAPPDNDGSSNYRHRRSGRYCLVGRCCAGRAQGSRW